MKKLFLMIAAVGVLFTACNKNAECGHDFIEHDFSQDLVGIWTCVEAENEFAEALVIKSDGSLELKGLVNGEYWETTGTIQVKNNKMIYKLDNGDEWEGRFEIVAGESFSMVLDDELDIRYTYQYCTEDLSEEVVGMWVCTYVPWMDADMAVNVYQADGKAYFTGFVAGSDNNYEANVETTYQEIGDLMFQSNPWKWDGAPEYLAFRLDYSPNGSELGDVLTNTNIMAFEGDVFETTASMIRIRQSLDLKGQTYDYKSAYVTNAKGKDEDFTIMGNTFNIAKIKAYDFDKMFSADLFSVELNANSFKYKLLLENGQDAGFDTPMTVNGNKVTLDMSAINPALRKVEMRMFQDANDTQVHVYMHTEAFINYFANMEVYTLIMEGKINPADSTAIAKVFADMEARVESINVSFVMKARK
jgi:hypothetical protein